MTSEQIESLFDLMMATSRQKRENIRSLYLDSIGPDIIPYCSRYFDTAKVADRRASLVQFVIRYSRVSDAAVELGLKALKDRSKQVRRMACGVLAYSLNEANLPALQAFLNHRCPETSQHAMRAIDAIATKDHNRFTAPDYDAWVVSRDRQGPPKHEEIDLYVRRFSPELIKPIEAILGSIYP